MSFRTAAWLGIAGLFLLSGCAREPGRVERVAVLRFENLTGDASLEWMGRALSEATAEALGGAPRTYVFPFSTIHATDGVLGMRPVAAPGISAERSQALMAGATRIVYGEYSLLNGRWTIDAVMEDVRTSRTVRTASVSLSGIAAIDAGADRISRELAGGAGPIATESAEAWRAYSGALESASPATSARLFSRATEVDPGFGPAWLAWVQAAAARQDRTGAEAVIEKAHRHWSAIGEADRVRLDYIAAVLRNDPAARWSALSALVRLTPDDPSVYREVGATALDRHDFRAAADALRRAAAIEPENVQNLNLLGYAEAYNGQLAAATGSLRRYAALRPQDPNPLDSLGDINFWSGNFAEAEKFYLAAEQKNAAFLGGVEPFKAANCRLMAGDIAGADELFQRYLKPFRAAGDRLTAYRQADWDWTVGRRREALQGLLAFAVQNEKGPLHEMASRALAQAAIWELELGRREDARAHAARAVAAAGAASAPLATLAAFLADPGGSPPERQERAQRTFAAPGQSGLRDIGLLYASLLARDFQTAGAQLEKLYRLPPFEAAQPLRVLLAWVDAQAGKWDQAAAMAAGNPLPRNAAPDPSRSLYLPRVFFVRGLVARHQGNAPEARRNFELFLKCSGPDALIWGEEEQARQALR